VHQPRRREGKRSLKEASASALVPSIPLPHRLERAAPRQQLLPSVLRPVHLRSVQRRLQHLHSAPLRQPRRPSALHLAPSTHSVAPARSHNSSRLPTHSAVQARQASVHHSSSPVPRALEHPSSRLAPQASALRAPRALVHRLPLDSQRRVLALLLRCLIRPLPAAAVSAAASVAVSAFRRAVSRSRVCQEEGLAVPRRSSDKRNRRNNLLRSREASSPNRQRRDVARVHLDDDEPTTLSPLLFIRFISVLRVSLVFLHLALAHIFISTCRSPFACLRPRSSSLGAVVLAPPIASPLLFCRALLLFCVVLCLPPTRPMFASTHLLVCPRNPHPPACVCIVSVPPKAVVPLPARTNNERTKRALRKLMPATERTRNCGSHRQSSGRRAAVPTPQAGRGHTTRLSRTSSRLSGGCHCHI
jgi:hypothetical protein